MLRVETTRTSRALAALRRRVDLWLQWSPDRWKRAFTFNIRFQKNIFGRMPHARRHDRGEILHDQVNETSMPRHSRERANAVRPFADGHARSARSTGATRSRRRCVRVARLVSSRPGASILAPFSSSGRAGTRDPGLELSLTVSLRSNRRRRRDMTFQIFVGGQRVNSADVLNTPAWSHQVRLSPPVTSHAHACSKKRGGCFCRL